MGNAKSGARTTKLPPPGPDLPGERRKIRRMTSGMISVKSIGPLRER